MYMEMAANQLRHPKITLQVHIHVNLNQTYKTSSDTHLASSPFRHIKYFTLRTNKSSRYFLKWTMHFDSTKSTEEFTHYSSIKRSEEFTHYSWKLQNVCTFFKLSNFWISPYSQNKLLMEWTKWLYLTLGMRCFL